MTKTLESIDDADQLDGWRDSFAATRYGVIRRAVSTDTAAIVVQYMQILHDYYQPLLLYEDQLRSFGRYNDPLGESVLACVWPEIKRRTGIDLLPTYSFFRMYRQGGRLAKHIDRPSCEVSATLLLGSDAEWPIWVDVDDEARAIHLDPGDLMVYRGCDVPHWREEFTGQYSVHMFLHFVEGSGPHAYLAFDERPGLGAPQTRMAPVRSRPRTGAEAEVANTDNMIASAQMQTRRNDPCPCGSGKRFKHCHGAHV